MNDTPETDKAKRSWKFFHGREVVNVYTARKLERERDEARKEAEWARDLIDRWSEASGTKFSWEND